LRCGAASRGPVTADRGKVVNVARERLDNDRIEPSQEGFAVQDGGRQLKRRSVVMTLGIVLGAAITTAGAQSGYEAPAVLHAADVAPTELLQSSVFKIDDRVPTDGLITKTTFQSAFGEFVAEGPGMMAVRATEIQALDVLSKTESSEIFQKAMAASMKRTGQSLKQAVTHPVDTVKGIPAGVGRFFDRVSRDVKTGMQKVGDAKSGEGGESGSSTSEEVKEGATMAGQSVIGYDDARRRLSKYLGVDPYTRNKTLADKLDSAAWAVWGGEFGPDTVIGFVPGGFAIKFTRDWVSDLVWDMTPGDLRVLMEKHLEELGVAQDPIDRFLRQPNFTHTVRLALVDSLRALGPGPGRTDVVDWALTATSETQARFMAGSVAILARHHQATPLARLRVAGTVLGETTDGTLVVPAAVDYVSWTERIASFAGRSDVAGAKARRLWLAGKVSPRTRQELTARKWTIEEGVSIVPPSSPGTPRS
jgi:hypothetical protein